MQQVFLLLRFKRLTAHSFTPWAFAASPRSRGCAQAGACDLIGLEEAGQEDGGSEPKLAWRTEARRYGIAAQSGGMPFATAGQTAVVPPGH